MAIKVNGVIHGTRVELEEKPDLPDGAAVVIEIEPRELTLEEKKDRVDQLCGAWADDPSLTPIFQQIERERQQPSTRQVSFDDLP